MTIRDQLNRLPHPYGELAISNTGSDELKKTKETVSKALYGGFVWEYSPQGHQFWLSVANWAQRHLDGTSANEQQLPPIP